jgi:hypothetical protein
MEYQHNVNGRFWNLHDFMDSNVHLEESMLSFMEFEEDM